MEDSRMGISAQGAGQGTDPPVPRCAFCTAWTGGSVPGFQAARLSTRIRNYGDVSKDRSLTVAALIGAPTVREGLLQNTRSHLRNGVLSVGQPILAAAGFQPALAGIEDSRMPRKSRLKGGCRQNCLPHKTGKDLGC